MQTATVRYSNARLGVSSSERFTGKDARRRATAFCRAMVLDGYVASLSR